MFNLYSRHKSPQENSRFEVTGHDRFGHVGVARSKHSSSVATFARSPKWRIKKEAILRQQQGQVERWRRSSLSSGHYTLLSVKHPTALTRKSSFHLSHASPSRLAAFDFSWMRQLLQQITCRSEGKDSCNGRTEDESLDNLIPR